MGRLLPILPTLLVAGTAAAQASAAVPNAPWSLLPPHKRVPAAPSGDTWCRDDIDRIVLAALADEGLAPAPVADRATLLRRVHLVLTGLPPTPDEVHAFVAAADGETCEREYGRQVDALLASPACAEHMAAVWLDLAHFADTFGYQADFECRTWPWRDWLLDALGRDLPYDEFLRQLVAGDLLPGATTASRTATAFFRLHRQTNEGGSIDEEWRQEYIADRVDTFGTAFLGLTVGCARCHDHKFDPISQRDFYALGSFFAIDEAGLYPYSTGAVPRPALRLATPAQQQELARLQQGVARAEAELAVAIARAPRDPDRFDEEPLVALCHRFDAVDHGKTAPEQRGKPPAEVPAGVQVVDGHTGTALQFDGDAMVTVPGAPAFTRDDPFGLMFRLWCPDRKQRAVVLHTSHYTEDADTQGYQILLKDGRLCWEIVHHWPGAAIALQTKDELPLQRWVHVTVGYDGSSRAAGMAIWLDGARAPTDVERDHLDGPATVRTLQLGGRDRDRGFAGGRLDDFEICAREPRDVDAWLHSAADTAFAAPDPVLSSVVVRVARAGAHDARKALHDYEDAIPELMVLAAHPQPPERFVLKRGAYDQPDQSQPVPPDAPVAVLPWEAATPRTRLGLAAWLTSPQNPLVARVQVNRLWSQCFGQGLVRTPEDFGRRGEPPARQALLDALAVDFASGGFSGKALLRRIVLSATFRQTSAAGPALRERDPDNRLLARGPSFRLSAEALRDQALAASGLLCRQLGGPSVKPWQPPGLWRDAGVGWGGADYKPDEGDNAHRRSLYTFRKRTAPPPDLATLDAGSREVCTARRATTDTPLQALVFLDDPVYVECAQALAARVLRECHGKPADAALASVFLALTARPPRPAEAAALRALFDGEIAAAATTGSGTDPALHALTLVCSTLFASDAVTVLR